MLKKIVFATAIITGLALSQSAYADWADKVTITGFASSTYQKTDTGEPLYGEHAGVTKDGSWYGTRVGLNINAQINEKIIFASQLFSSREEDNYVSHLDWGFMAIQLTDELTLRTGRIKYPVGIVNEYRSVGSTYLWIAPPQLFYNAEASITRESYSGASMYWEMPGDEWLLSANLFYGDDANEGMQTKKLSGLTVNGEWNDQIMVQASWFTGKMHTSGTAPMEIAMNERNHTVITLGTRINIANFIAYLEWADVDMDDFLMGKGEALYATLGYQIGDFTPHVTYQTFEKGLDTMSPNEQNMTTMGVRYDWMPNLDVKFEVSSIETDKGAGLFEKAPGKTVTMYGVAFDVLF